MAVELGERDLAAQETRPCAPRIADGAAPVCIARRVRCDGAGGRRRGRRTRSGPPARARGRPAQVGDRRGCRAARSGGRAPRRAGGSAVPSCHHGSTTVQSGTSPAGTVIASRGPGGSTAAGAHQARARCPARGSGWCRSRPGRGRRPPSRSTAPRGRARAVAAATDAHSPRIADGRGRVTIGVRDRRIGSRRGRAVRGARVEAERPSAVT